MPARATGLTGAIEDAVPRLRYAYATGLLTIGELRDALRTGRRNDPGELARLIEGLPEPPPRQGPRGGPLHRSYPMDMTTLRRLAAITDPLRRCVTAAAKADAAKAEQETARQHRDLALVAAHVRYGVSQRRCYDPYGGISARRPYRHALRQEPANLPRYEELLPRLQKAADPAAVAAARDELKEVRGELEKTSWSSPQFERLAERAAELSTVVAAASDSSLAKQVAWIQERILLVSQDEDVAKAEPGGIPAIAFADYWHARYEAARSTAETARLVRDRLVRELTDDAHGSPQVINAELARLTGYSSARIAQIRTSPITA
jgi:hypothetical protein